MSHEFTAEDDGQRAGRESVVGNRFLHNAESAAKAIVLRNEILHQEGKTVGRILRYRQSSSQRPARVITNHGGGGKVIRLSGGYLGQRPASGCPQATGTVGKASYRKVPEVQDA